MNSLRGRSSWVSSWLAMAILVVLADAVWSAPPIRFRPPTPAPVPRATPIRPPSEAFIPPAAGPSVRSGAMPEEMMRGQSSFRPVPFVPIRPRPGSGQDDERSEERSAGAREDRAGGAWPIWLLLIVPLAGGVLLLFVVVLLIDLVAKRRRGGAQRASSVRPLAD